MILDALNTDLYTAMKEKDQFKAGALRYLIAQIQNKEIELRGSDEELTDEQILRVIKKQIKQRKQSIEQYQQAGREESVEKETAELKILEEYFERFKKELGIEL